MKRKRWERTVNEGKEGLVRYKKGRGRKGGEETTAGPGEMQMVHEFGGGAR